MESVQELAREYLPFWEQLSALHQQKIIQSASIVQAPAGRIIHNGSADCVGLLIVLKGRLRVYTVAEEGREITLYRLLQRDICLLSASCAMRSLEFDVIVATESDTSYLQIPSGVYKELMQESLPVANYTNELMASRFSDVMWLLDQILNKKLDARLAAFLLEEASLDETHTIQKTHEEIARYLGSAREVVTRLLKYLSGDGLVTLSRGGIRIDDAARLEKLAEGSVR